MQKQKADIAKSMWVGATISYHQEQLWASQWGYKQRALGFLGGPERGLLEILHSRPGVSGASKAHDPQARWSWITTHSRMSPQEPLRTIRFQQQGHHHCPTRSFLTHGDHYPLYRPGGQPLAVSLKPHKAGKLEVFAEEDWRTL